MKLFDRVRTEPASPLPASLYAQGVAPPERHPLDGDRRCDVAIVGGGILGLSTALALAEAGTDTVVLEASCPGWGASGRNGGQVNSGLKHPPDKVIADLGPDALQLSYGAPATLRALVARLGLDCDFVHGGGYRTALDPAGRQEIEALARACDRHGLPGRLMDAPEIARATGTDRYLNALHDPEAGQLNPLKYALGLARAAAAAGATICADTPVLSAAAPASSPGSWQLHTPGGTVHADRVVFATNGYSDGLVPGLRRSLLPVFSTIVATEPLPGPLRARILPGREVLYETGIVTVYYRVDAEGRLLMGGRGPARPGSGRGLAPHLVALAERLWPELRGLDWPHGWNGRIAMTADHYPHVHEVGGGGLACAGFNGRGVALATALGPRLARHVLDGTPLPFPTTPPRPIPFQWAWPAGVEAVLAWQRLRALAGTAPRP